MSDIKIIDQYSPKGSPLPNEEEEMSGDGDSTEKVYYVQKGDTFFRCLDPGDSDQYKRIQKEIYSIKVLEGGSIEERSMGKVVISEDDEGDSCLSSCDDQESASTEKETYSIKVLEDGSIQERSMGKVVISKQEDCLSSQQSEEDKATISDNTEDTETEEISNTTNTNDSTTCDKETDQCEEPQSEHSLPEERWEDLENESILSQSYQQPLSTDGYPKKIVEEREERQKVESKIGVYAQVDLPNKVVNITIFHKDGNTPEEIFQSRKRELESLLPRVECICGAQHIVQLIKEKCSYLGPHTDLETDQGYISAKFVLEVQGICLVHQVLQHRIRELPSWNILFPQEKDEIQKNVVENEVKRIAQQNIERSLKKFGTTAATSTTTATTSVKVE